LILVLFFSCQEDLNYLGFKSNQQRFKVYYAEIPVGSSVLWMDSLETMNSISTKTTNRILVGSYSDPEFGKVHAESYSQFAPTNITTVIPTTAVFDSVVLQLYYDFYVYGSSGKSVQDISIHEITKDLKNDSVYYSNSTVVYNPTPLGNQSLVIDADFFTKEAEDTDKDSVITIKIKLDPAFGKKLFDAVDPEDENYTNFNLFKTTFKGLAIIPQAADVIAGMKTNNVNTALILYYHNAGTNSKLLFSLSGVNFSKIPADRSSTELAGLNKFYTDFTPGNNRYLQAGTSLVTKLDFSKYYEYIDSLEDIIINSAELSVDNINPDGGFKKPSVLALAMLTEKNRYKTLQTRQDTIDFVNFNGTLVLGNLANDDLQASLFAANDQGSLLTHTYSTNNNSYTGSYPTLLFQKLFDLREKPYPYWALMSSSPPFSKSVNRTVFQKDNIKLKIYYTRPFIGSPK